MLPKMHPDAVRESVHLPFERLANLSCLADVIGIAFATPQRTRPLSAGLALD